MVDAAKKQNMYQRIKKYADAVSKEFEQIPSKRKEILEKITDYILSKQQIQQPVYLLYICTHNSRRSHFGQLWATVACDYYAVQNVHAFSGGTEVTEFHPNAIRSLKKAGFKIQVAEEGKNPIYQVHYCNSEQAVPCFSKVYNHPINPQAAFAAIMTCSDAEENCPFIPGFEFRTATTYDDPKTFDETPLQDSKYDDRCRQIARETFYLFSKINV